MSMWGMNDGAALTGAAKLQTTPQRLLTELMEVTLLLLQMDWKLVTVLSELTDFCTE